MEGREGEGGGVWRPQLVAVGEYVCMIMSTSAAGVVVPVRPRPSVGIYFFPLCTGLYPTPFFQARAVPTLGPPFYKDPLWL